MDRYKIYPNDFKYLHQRLKKDICFMIMPFADEKREIYNTVKRAAESCNMICQRADEVKRSSPFMHNIVSSINTSYYIIVDISGLNPNVLYELGIAHTLRTASKVLILKDNTTECPSDLKHINYFTYNVNAFSTLFDHVVNFIKSNASLDDLGEILLLLNIVDNDCLYEFMRDIQKNLYGYHTTLINIFNRAKDELITEEVNELLKIVLKRINILHRESMGNLIPIYTNLIVQALSKLVLDFSLNDFIDFCFYECDWVDKKLMKNIQADIATVFINYRYNNTIFNWIKIYLINTSPAAVDLIKFKMQVALINSNLQEVNQFLLENISEHENDTMIEHCLNLCKERGISQSIPQAQSLMKSKNNPYIFRSALDVITQLGNLNDLLQGLETVQQRSEFISQNKLINSHVEILKNKIKN